MSIEKRDKSNWISVKEKLPSEEIGMLVVLAHTYADDGYMEYSIANCITLSDGKNYWCDIKYGYLEHPRYTDGFGGSSMYKVIAWKPIEEYEGDK